MDFLRFLKQLTNKGIDYVIVGGVAARLHGSTRLTHDVDIVVRLEPEPWTKTIDAIWEKGGRPRIPEPLERIRKLDNIRRWMDEKRMLALSFRSERGDAEIDLLLSEAHRFSELKERALSVVLGDHTFWVASIDDLVRMKRLAGRPQDLLDIDQLLEIKARIASS